MLRSRFGTFISARGKIVWPKVTRFWLNPDSFTRTVSATSQREDPTKERKPRKSNRSRIFIFWLRLRRRTVDAIPLHRPHVHSKYRFDGSERCPQPSQTHHS